MSGKSSSIQSARESTCILVKKGLTRTDSWTEDISVVVVGDQSGVMLSEIGTEGTAGIADTTKTSARNDERAIYGFWVS